jgi:CheY-like chemotaxis protein
MIARIMSAKAASRPPPANILVAEDDANDVLLLRRALDRAGVVANVHFVFDGREAIDYLQESIRQRDPAKYPMPDLLMLDLNMPAVGGLEVLSWLSTQPELAGLRVVVFSSCIAPDASAQATRLGAYRCITKPMDPLEWVPIFRELHGELGGTERHLQAGPNPPP